jgi:hypothetical protein
VVESVGDAVSLPVKDGGVVGLIVVGSSVDTSTNPVGRNVAIEIGGDDVATGASITTTGGNVETIALGTELGTALGSELGMELGRPLGLMLGMELGRELGPELDK